VVSATDPYSRIYVGEHLKTDSTWNASWRKDGTTPGIRFIVPQSYISKLSLDKANTLNGISSPVSRATGCGLYGRRG
jgi:hypothetical protein